jgi:hypothetical protein
MNNDQMAKQVQPSFPVFVIAKDADEEFFSGGILDLPDTTKFSTAMVPFKGKNKACLSWFTSLKTAKAYMTKSKINGIVVSMSDALEAANFLSRQDGEFFGVCLNPVGPGHKPTTYRYADFIALFRRLAAGQN